MYYRTTMSFFLIFLLFSTITVNAHSPHDPIKSIALSPAIKQDKTLFIIITDHILKSEDGGYSWKELSNGLDHKNYLTSIAISPAFVLDGILFISSLGDGIYKSNNGGMSWSKVNKGLNNLKVRSLYIIPSNNQHNIIMAACDDGGLYRTINNGGCWEQVLANDINITSIDFYKVLSNIKIIAGDIDGNIYFTTDYGNNWKKRYQIPGSGIITVIKKLPDSFSSNTFLIGTENRGILKIVIDENSTELVTTNIKDKHVIDIAISPSYHNDSLMLATTRHEAVYQSRDHGNTWNIFKNGLTSDKQADSKMYKSSHFRDVKIANDYKNSKIMFLGGFDGLFKSTDYGKTWFQLETLPLRLIKGFSVAENGLSVAITTYGGGAYKSSNSGDSWKPINNGLLKTRLSDIVFSPYYSDDKTLFSAHKKYLLKSTNGGKTWNRCKIEKDTWKDSLNSFFIAIVQKLGLSKSIKSIFTSKKIKPYPTIIALSPDFKNDNILFFGTRTNGIYQSNDGGLTSKRIWRNIEHNTVTSIVISPIFSKDHTLFIAIRKFGVFKSIDGGNSWFAANNGLFFIDQWKKTLDSHDIRIKDLKLVISPSFNSDNTVFAASSSGLYKTTDGGIRWKQVKSEAYGSDAYIIGIAISPNYSSDQTLLLSVKGKGLFESTNGGLSFYKISPELTNNNHSIEYIEFSPNYSYNNTIYAASDEEVFIKKNGSKYWDVIKRPVRYENNREVIHYNGNWKIKRCPNCSASSINHSSSYSDKATLNFIGTGVSWIGTTANDQGTAKVFIDKKYVSTVDQYSPQKKYMQNLYTINNLGKGYHTITIEIVKAKNEKSKGYRIEIDAFDIYT